MFTDRVKITIASGDGGNGHVSFRREKYVPNGGPNGGDGGNGGDVIFEVDRGLNTLSDFRHMKRYAAGNGKEGGKNRCHGRSGDDIILNVPEGTLIREAESGKIIADMSGGNNREVVLKGGRGGSGNMHFATSTMQAPRYAQPGRPGEELCILLELKVIADVGLLGFPNVGKSTFLARVTKATPRIADYPFTTLHPHLGVVDMERGRGFVMADIPGLIEGASEGVGLGHDFLRHLERTRILIHMVDASGMSGRDPVKDVITINRELENYSEKLSSLPQVIAAARTDAWDQSSGEKSPAALLKEAYGKEHPVFEISSVTGRGIRELINFVYSELEKLPTEPVVFEREYVHEPVREELPFFVERESNGVYTARGAMIDKMLGFTNLESEKGMAFFQKFMNERGVIDKLRQLGLSDGDTVKVYGHEFIYYDEGADGMADINDELNGGKGAEKS